MHKTTRVTIIVDVEHTERINPDDITTDLTRMLRDAHEPKPERHDGSGWFVNGSVHEIRTEDVTPSWR